MLLVLTITTVYAASMNTTHDASSIAGDVVVYGATAAGCAAAIAASRSGASHIILASPYPYVGGMTTGGIMHADVGNKSTIAGITREYFLRVVSHYPHKPRPSPQPSSPAYKCINDRCVLVDRSSGSSSDPKCAGICKPLASNEWLAVRSLSVLSGDNKTLTVRLKGGQKTSYIKKTERLCDMMPNPKPASLCHEVHDGEKINLLVSITIFDTAYFLIELPSKRTSAQGALGSPRPGHPPGWLYESHVAERVLEEMLAEANVTIIRNLKGLANATFDAGKSGVLQSITSETGVTLIGSVWVDGTYEGDLANVAGASMVWGRESKDQYNESGAGRRPVSLTYNVDPYWSDGSLIPHISDGKTMVGLGEADLRMQVYTFRLCITNSPGHRLPFSKPASYNASEWEFWRRLYKNGTDAPQSLRSAGLGCLGPIPNNYSDCGDSGKGECVKCDMLGMKHGTDLLNGAWTYPNATTKQRVVIRDRHIQYILGLLWFWSSDPASGTALHEEMAELGYCTDEYVGDSGFENDPPNWPYQLYVREAKRLVGDWVWTEHVPSEEKQKRSIGLGAYVFDCHWVTLYDVPASADGKIKAAVVAEGRVNQDRDGHDVSGVTQAPYRIPYDALLPKRAELTNVLVPVAASMSHVRQNAVRMEPTWMIMGHAAGSAAAMVAEQSENVSGKTIAVQDLNVTALQNLLVEDQNQMIWPDQHVKPPSSHGA